MVGVLMAVLLLVLLAGIVAWAAAAPRPAAASGRLPATSRSQRRVGPVPAHWSAAHDEVDGTTRVLLRRTVPGPDGRPEVLEERVFETFPARDPLWEARFTEAMADARFRCRYLDAEEEPPG
ncbi:hypothetical protein [Modestobacter versicolor]|uniref:hypothetical protein n=1 Tax=Modestobacter versicolor TaxID=429133 RepID=UPI0034DF5467